ncbi:hypothetical protein [Algoriphagus pacificus]|uniref:Uncharacterized protein n=1 Tax=Algoriphagus pacificus TaxID=2811234 RepID=A0ABS3CIL2_9BACT|nr:hypothetical protein [Algoriphagus pacificus]MBN7816938.1 hypothetical protein [Algoriphagus pacificus]
MERLNLSKLGIAFLMLCCIGTAYILFNLNHQTEVHRGVLAKKHEFGLAKRALLQFRFGSKEDPCRLTVVNEDEEIIQVIGSGQDVEEGDTIYYIEKESILGFIYYVREE